MNRRSVPETRHSCRRGSGVFLLAMLSILLLAPAVSALSPTGVIRTLFIGDPFMTPGFPTPAMVEDPKISLTPVRAEVAFVTTTEMKKFMRIYLPRTKEKLASDYDLIILSAVKANSLTGTFEKWMAEAVLEDGLGLLMVDDPVSFGCVDAWEGLGSPSWMPTPVGKILPVEDNSRMNYGRGYDFKVKPIDPDHPVMKGIPWKEMWFYAHNRPTRRPGSTVIAVTYEEQGNQPKNNPFITYWDIEKGRTMALLFDWGGRGQTEFYRWRYWKDCIARWVYFPARAKIPEDVELAHKVRQLFSDYSVKKGIALSMTEFADKFGANTRPAEKTLAEVEQDRKQANRFWIQGDLQACLESMQASLEKLDQAAALALKAKNTALTWVYVIEWSVVTSTACIAGVVLWALMVRRRMYKEIETTRFER